MAPAEDRRDTLAAWAQALPQYRPWRERHLLRRFGPLVAGICLDALRDPRRYTPTFFLHNLAAPWPALTMGYPARLMVRGVAGRLAHGQPIEQAVQDFVGQVPHIGAAAFGFADFMAHARLVLQGRFGPVGVYLPHLYRDMALLGAHAGDAEFFARSLEEACERLRCHERLNLALIGSVEAWRADLAARLPAVTEALVEANRGALKLPGDMPSAPFHYERPPSAFADLEPRETGQASSTTAQGSRPP